MPIVEAAKLGVRSPIFYPFIQGMGRCLRFIPDGHMVETTLRTVQGRLLLRPSRTTTRTVAGVLGRAQRLYGMEIHAVVAMGNHVHCLLSPRDAKQLADFMRHVGANIARKVGSLVGWREKFWGRRYRAIVVSDEERAQVARLRYLLAHGAKEGFVLDPLDWPGLNVGASLAVGAMSVEGTWYDGTAAYRDRLAGKEKPREAYGSQESILLSPLPCWRHLSPEVHRDAVISLLDDIRRETVQRHNEAETAPTGAAFVLAQDAHEKPRLVKRTPAPAFHTATRDAWHQLRDAYLAFVAAYREAASKLRAGVLPVAFPAGSFPPALPFVPG